ncbi:fibropellin-1, partial [Plakobranchus ocellatus]
MGSNNNFIKLTENRFEWRNMIANVCSRQDIPRPANTVPSRLAGDLWPLLPACNRQTSTLESSTGTLPKVTCSLRPRSHFATTYRSAPQHTVTDRSTAKHNATERSSFAYKMFDMLQKQKCGQKYSVAKRRLLNIKLILQSVAVCKCLLLSLAVFDEVFSPLCFRYGAKLVEPVGYVLTDVLGALVTSLDPSVDSVWTEVFSPLCFRYGAKLVEPVGHVLTDVLGALVTSLDPSVDSVWTGYTREGYSPASDDTGAFWSDGTSATVDVGVWGHQEPKIDMGDCAYMQRHDTGWKWYIGVCDQLRAFVCEATPCPTESYRCDSGLCVAPSLRCNGENNCGDDSDERDCPSECSVYITNLGQDLVYPGTNIGSYGNQENCMWVVEGAVGGRIYMEIKQLNTEKGVDFLELWGGGRTLSASVLLRRVSGSLADALAEAPIIVSPNNMAIVRFTSDASVTNSGFRIHWRSVTFLHKIPTTFPQSSSNSPPTSLQHPCNIFLTFFQPSLFHIPLKFLQHAYNIRPTLLQHSFNIPPIFLNHSSKISPTFLQYPLNIPPKFYQHPSNVSPTFLQQRRFKTEFECDLISTDQFSAVPLDGNPSSPTASSDNGCYNQCLQDQSCVAATFDPDASTCTKMSEMPRVSEGHTNEVLFIKTCPGRRGNAVLSDVPVVSSTLYATTTPARLFSPLYPVFYPGGQSYIWTITAPGQNVITVEILDMQLGSHDYVRFYDGPDLRSKVIMTVTSRDAPSSSTFTSSGNRLLVYFRSNSYADVKGFLLSYRQGCDYVLSGSSGTIQSPGFELGTYPNAMECTWTISTDQARALRLNFDTFSLETDSDFLQIFKDNSASPVHSGSGYTGSNLPPSVDSSDGQVRLVMTTNALTSSTGFRATYNAGCLPISDASISMSPSSTVFRGDKVTVTCKNNFVFASPYTGQGSVVLTCGLGGDWDREVPTCTQVLCGNVPRISNGYLQSVTGVLSGNTATYVCNSGFRLYPDNSPSTCTNTGQWQPYPFCLAEIQCPPLLAPTHGELDVVLGNGRDTGSVVRFLCSTSGYELVGTSVISCEGGSWSADTPTCQRQKCGLPYIANATLSPTTNIGQGDIITVTCRPGFQLFGSSQFQCGSYVNLPTCQNIDECANFQSRCSQICVDLPGGYTCSCRDGFTLGFDGFTCNDINECSVNNGYCQDLCTNTIGSYFCSCPSSSAELFTRSGQFGVFLPPTEDGRQPWNIYHLNHTCLFPPTIDCPELSRTISNGRMLSDQATHGAGDSVTYLCNLGHEMIGPATLTCSSSGEWDNNPPQCVAATCPPPSTGTTVVSPSSEIGYLEYFTGTCNVQGLGEIQLRSRCTYSIQAQSYQASITDLQCPLGVSCGQPTRLPGSDAYVLSGTDYGSTFTFRCRASYFRQEGQSSLLKNNVVTCMGDGRWDFGDLRCIAPSCVDPGTRPGVIQDATSYEEYSLVYYRCVRGGFEPTDKRPLLCFWDPTDNTLKWNGTAPDCVDVEPPTFSNCGSRDLAIPKLTRPTVNDPTALDNVKVTSFRVTPSNHLMSQVLIADRSVTYLAQDAAGNTATCDIDIKIRDEEPPVLTCVDSFTVRLTTSSSSQSYSINDLITSQSDNSGSVSLLMTPSQLTFDRRSVDETYTVKITASDPAGNTDICLVQIKVEATPCVDWSIYVANGQTSCVPSGNGYTCTVTCDAGYVLHENPALSSVTLTCQNGGSWSRERPVCVAQRADVYRQSFQLRYQTGSSIPASCVDTYTAQLSTKMPSVLQSLEDLCSNTFPPAQVSAAAGTPLISIQADTIYSTFTMDITATGGSTNQNNNAVDQCAAYIRNAFVSVTNTIFAVSRLSSEAACPGSAQANFQTSIQDGLGCGNNERAYTDNGQETCLTCPPGFSSRNGQQCSACAPGTYFSSEFAGCVACPDNARWVGTGARSEMDCYLTCPYGYSSSSGSAPCQICPKNTYSRDRNTCAACPNTLLTSQDGQALISSCRGVCEAGYYSKDGLEPCTPCPRGFYQSSVQSTTCSECNSDSTTNNIASTSFSDCVDGEPVLCDQFKCLNGGTCTVYGHDYYCECREGYTGRNCDFYISPCASQPCYNQAICTPTGTLSYTCDCPTSQLTGPNCETNTNEICLNNPCQNFGGCKTGVANYMCLCPSYSMYSYGVSGFGS